jgi:hypothetical protein
MSVELSDFERDTLVQIVRGIRAAQAMPEVGKCVPEGEIQAFAFPHEFGVVQGFHNIGTAVKFDVAIVAERNTEAGAKAEIGVGVLEAAIGGSKGGRQASTSRIQFAVPLLIPENGDSSDLVNRLAFAPSPLKLLNRSLDAATRLLRRSTLAGLEADPGALPLQGIATTSPAVLGFSRTVFVPVVV